MSKVLFQIVGEDGRVLNYPREWNLDTQAEMFDIFIAYVDSLPEDKMVFVILDVFSEVKIKEETKAEKIVREQREKAAIIIEQMDMFSKSTLSDDVKTDG